MALFTKKVNMGLKHIHLLVFFSLVTDCPSLWVLPCKILCSMQQKQQKSMTRIDIDASFFASTLHNGQFYCLSATSSYLQMFLC